MTTPSRKYLCLLTSKLKTKPATQLFAIAFLALLASIGISQQPSVMLASGGGGGNDGGGGGGGGRRDLASLKTVAVPRPTNIVRYIKDETAAIQLGKALFWDQQVGSDGQACASCHFHAGADNRSKNQLNPGFRAVPQDFTFTAPFGPNYQLQLGDFPLHRLADPNDQNSAVLFDTNDIVSSQGVQNFTFTNVIVGNATDVGAFQPDPVFSVFSFRDTANNRVNANVRRVEPRNTPTMINAVFNHRNFWDGRARNEFNGVDPIGILDPGAQVLHVAAPGQAPQLVSLIDGSHPELALNNSSLASQAVGPPLSDLEMSFANRTFVLLGRKMIAARALASQRVAPDDSVLGTISVTPGTGLTMKYDAMIRAAIQPEWWDSNSTIQITNGSVSVLGPQAPLAANQFTMMEFNFSLIWGLAIQEYESTLVADNSRFDQFMEGNRAALTDQEQRGLDRFTGKAHCDECHGGPELSTASVSNVQTVGILQRREIAQGTALVDTGFFNTGVRNCSGGVQGPCDDGGIGVTIGPLILPLSFARFFQLPQNNAKAPIPVNPNERVAVDGAFKVPGLRNVELTAPYMHNGGMATLEQVVDFYSRGADFALQNAANLGPRIKNLGLGPDDKAALVAFLKALTDERVRLEKAPFDHPELIVFNGSIGNNTQVSADGTTGNSMQDTIRIPAVGRNGLATPPPNFLQ
jgi:cytochrome c peroxidase